MALLFGVLLGAGLVIDVVSAAPASAHAVVVSTDPADGARLEQVPDQVRLQFNEPVGVGAGYARVLGPGGDRVDTGAAAVDDATVTIPLSDDLGEGSYVVTYRVVSADSHPVSGAYTFIVGNGALASTPDADLTAGPSGAVTAALSIGRWLGYLGILLAAGAPVFVAACWPAGWRDRRVRRAVAAGITALALSGVIDFLLQGPNVAGRGLGSAGDPSLWAVTASSLYGQVLLGRVAIALLLAGLLARSWRDHRPGRGVQVVGGLLLTLAAVSLTLVGHAVAGPWPALAVASNTLHVAAMTVWIGGLVVLTIAVLPHRTPSPALIGQMTSALARFSPVAFGCVTVLAATGVFQGIREVGSVTDLFTTAYGQLLLTKTGLFLLVLILAALARDWVQQHTPARRQRTVTAQALAAPEPVLAGPLGVVRDTERRADLEDDLPAPAVDDGVVRDRRGRPVTATEVRTVRRSLLVEVTLAAAVLAVTAVLTGTASATASTPQPVTATLPLDRAAGGGSVQISLSPATVGANRLDLYLYDAAGQLTDPVGIQASVTEQEHQIGPLPVDLTPAGRGHYQTPDLLLPAAGTWTLTVTVRSGEFQASSVAQSFIARPDRQQ
jgi:copper transport protein